MYALGIAVALVVGAIFSRTILRADQSSAFVLELPPYRRPALRGLLLHTWERVRAFLGKAGKVILAASLALWLLLNLPLGTTDQKDSLYGQVSQAISPVFVPVGFGDWESTGALISGFAAKEVVVSALSQIFGTGAATEEPEEPAPDLGQQLAATVTGFGDAVVSAGRTLLGIIPGVNLVDEEDEPEDTDLSAALRAHYTPLSAFAFLAFVLLYVPCMATLGAIKQEFGGRWAVMSGVYQTTVAWLVAFIIFQGGTLLGLG
jgi:ferrous iron transport protein B